MLESATLEISLVRESLKGTVLCPWARYYQGPRHRTGSTQGRPEMTEINIDWGLNNST